MSHRAEIFYVDLVIRSGVTLDQAIVEARQLDQLRRDSGFEQGALDDAARMGFANGAFEDLAEDVPAVVEEFYPEDGGEQRVEDRESAGSNLRGRLESRIAATGHGG
jgi:hypothetical protein